MNTRFEAAVEAILDGDASTLRRLLSEDPSMTAQRSLREHRAMLLHYVAANGVEQQRSPKNLAEMTRILLDAGADPNATCDLYGGKCTTLSLLVSSAHPRAAGVELPVLHLLIDYGASMKPEGEGLWTSPIETALVFHHFEAARALAARGAPVLTVAAAAGLGDLASMRRMLPESSALDRHRAVAMAAINDQVDALRMLIEAGEDLNRLNPAGAHAHSTPLHQAIVAGSFDAVKVLIEHGARTDVRDTVHHATPLGWAEYCKQPAIAQYLRSIGVTE